MNSKRIMATPLGQRNWAIIGRLSAFVSLLFLLTASAKTEIVQAYNYDSFWLWAGVKPQPALANAKEIYLLAGEVSNRGSPHIISQRSAVPHVSNAKVWVVYRAQTIAWNEAILSDILAHIETWRIAGNNIEGLQIDFDAGTKHLDQYADFLGRVRAKLGAQYRLSVTGLLDWSANGDPEGLQALNGVVDEVVLQIYQGRHVIAGYAGYLKKLDGFQVSFKIGLLQGGDWVAPIELKRNPNFKGYIVFLLNPRI